MRAHVRPAAQQLPALPARAARARRADRSRAKPRSIALLERVTRRRIDVIRIRIHGDYHLGQVLWTGEDFVIIDFEGEPGRPLSRAPLQAQPAARRRRHAALARTTRSVAALRDGRHRAEDLPVLAPWARAWASGLSASFLGGYLDRAAARASCRPTTPTSSMLLEFFLLEKCIYEIDYELNNRPDWVEIPLRGLLELLPSAPPPARARSRDPARAGRS